MIWTGHCNLSALLVIPAIFILCIQLLDWSLWITFQTGWHRNDLRSSVLNWRSFYSVWRVETIIQNWETQFWFVVVRSRAGADNENLHTQIISSPPHSCSGQRLSRGRWGSFRSCLLFWNVNPLFPEECVPISSCVQYLSDNEKRGPLQL